MSEIRSLPHSLFLQQLFTGLAACLVLFAPGSWSASPSLSTILPRGAPRGATTEVIFQGSSLEDAVDVLFHQTGIQLRNLMVVDPQQVKCVFEIAATTPLGTQAVRLRTRSGLSNLVLFSVGNLKEVNESEPNGEPGTAQGIDLNTTVNGTITSEDLDFFAVDLAVGARIAVEIEALRLGGALFDPKLRFFDPTGHELVAEDDTCLLAQDAAFVQEAGSAGRYHIAVSEAAYGGGSSDYYRLHVGTFPRPLSVTPRGGVAGSSVEVSWLGDPGIGKQPLDLPAGEPGKTVSVPVANDQGQAPTPVRFRLGGSPSIAEVEPNNQPDQATAGPAAGPFEGTLSEPGDEDWFQFEGQAGQVLDVRVWARDLGSPLDSLIRVTGPSGGDLLSDDDSSGMDSSGRITLAEAGAHRISVRDHLGRGGPWFTYRVELAPVQPRLEMSLAENKPVMLSVPRGNQALLLLTAKRSDFGGFLKVGFGGLPPGITFDTEGMKESDTTIPVVLSAAEEAPVAGALVDVTAEFQAEGQPAVRGHLNQEVVLAYWINETAFFTLRVDRLALAVTEPAPFKIEVVQPKVPIVKNGALDLVVRAVRLSGFADPIELRVPWLPSGMGAGTAQIPAGATQASIHLDAAPSSTVGNWRMVLAGTSGGYSVCTPFANIEVSDPWVTFEVGKQETERGKPTQIAVKLTQARPFEGTYQAELIGLPGGISTVPQPFSSATAEILFPVIVSGDAPAGKHEGLFVRAVLSAQGEAVLHQSGSGQLVVYEPLPPQLQEQAPPPVEASPGQPPRKTRFAAN